MTQKAVHHWPCGHNYISRGSESKLKQHNSDFSIKRKSGSREQESKKVNGTKSCILFSVDWQVASTDCPSALWHGLPISAGFGNDWRNIWGLLKEKQHLILSVRRKNLKNRGQFGHLEEWVYNAGLSVWGPARQWNKKTNKCHILFHPAPNLPSGFIKLCVCVCVWVFGCNAAID